MFLIVHGNYYICKKCYLSEGQKIISYVCTYVFIENNDFNHVFWIIVMMLLVSLLLSELVIM